MSFNRIALNYVNSMEFQHRLKLVKEHEDISKRLSHLERRYNIDKISDPVEAKEVKQEIEKSYKRLKEILDELSF